MDTFRKWLNKPKADDKSLLARFYHADRALTAVASELDSFDGRAEPDRCSRLVSRLRQGQDKVLSITNRIMEELLGDDRAPRAFRAKFPEEVLQENLAGQLWFGAECLAAGSSIMNREFESAAMRPLAQAVTKSLDNVRNLLRDQCLRNNIPNSPTLKLDINDSTTEQLYESLKIFDRLFAEFELRYVSAMVQVKSKQEYEMQELICVLFSETLQRALQIHLLEQDQVDSFDPALMFSIPRLAIVTGLIIFNKGPLNMDMPADQLSEMFRPFRTILIKIRDLLKTLNKTELYQLEKLLCTNEEIHLKQINGNNNNNNNNNSSLNNSQSDQNNSQSLVVTENKVENQNKIAIKDDILTIERRSSKLSEKLKQLKEKDRQRQNERENDKKNNSDVVNGENPKSNDCDQDLVSTNSNNVLDNSQQINNKTSTSTTLSKQTKYNEIISRANHKSSKSSSRNVSASKFSKLQSNQDNNNENIVSASPTNSISSASSSATTADISSDWTDDDDNDNNGKLNEKKLKELSNDASSDLATADCATGFLIPNTNFGNLLQQNDDPLTDNIVASEDEYASAGDNEILINGNSLNNVTIGTLTTTLPSNIATNSTDNIRNNNNSFIEDSSSITEKDEPKNKLKSSKTPLKISNKIKYSLSTTPLAEQPSCSRMDITDSSDESEISQTITKKAQEQQSSIASTTTANSNPDTKSSCDSISKSSKSSTTSGCDDGAVSNASARKHETKSGKHHRHHHHHHHHHHHNRNCHNHHRHVGNSNTLTVSSNSSSMTTTSSTDRSSTSTNSIENNKTREYRHHSRKHKSKRQQGSTNNTHHNSVDCASSGDTTSSLSDGDPHEVDLALRAAGRMKFKSTENLLHRLFVCIAGVADQLQTNFASDLRQILRSVFFMNTTPVQEKIKIPEKSKDSSDLFEFRPSESDVIQENNAGSNQSIYSAAEEANPESDNVFINDGSPNQSIDSGSNSSSNQEQQIQQHNRTNRHSERGNSLDSANSIIQHQASRQQQHLNEYNHKNNSRTNIERTRSLGEECQENEQNTRKLHLLQERRRLSSQGSNSAGSESPVNSSASNSPVGERSIRTANCYPNNDETAVISTGTATTIGATAYSQQPQIASNPINVIRRSTDRRSSTSQVLSQSTTNRRNANNNISNTSASLPKPSPPAWIPDEDAPRCMACTIPFTAFRRRHHCRNCGGVFCGGCSNSSAPLPKYGLTKAVRVCRDCYVREVGT